MEMNAPTYFEHYAGNKQNYAPRETDLIDFNEPETTGIEVRELTPEEWIRELER
jgi:hypothetical protein